MTKNLNMHVAFTGWVACVFLLIGLERMEINYLIMNYELKLRGFLFVKTIMCHNDSSEYSGFEATYTHIGVFGFFVLPI